MVVFTLLLNLTVFSQAKSDTTCYYQPPRITCVQAQLNAQAIVKYPIALQSLTLKDDMLRIKESELFHVKAGFNDERQLYQIDMKALTDSYNRELRRKKRWRFGAGVLAIMAGAFYLK
jgi:hypothetical protein